MAKSILHDESCCFLCGRRQWLEEHHVFGGYGKRQLSEKYGLKVYLCHWCHNEPPHGVHHNKNTRIYLQQAAQIKAMEYYNWTEDEFRQKIGKNYL